MLVPFQDSNWLEGSVLFSTNGPRRTFCFASHAAQVVLEEPDPVRCEASIRELPSFREVGRIISGPNGTVSRRTGSRRRS